MSREGCLNYVRSHTCKLLENAKDKGIDVVQYEMYGKSNWYYKLGNRLNVVLYCPFCGEKLDD